MTLESLNELYLSELSALYNAEKQLIKTLPKIIQKTDSAQLRQALKTHLEEAYDQTARLEWVYEVHGENPNKQRNKSVESLLAEGEEMVGSDAAPAARDAAIIAALQRVKHYEIAVYSTARTYAQQLGHDATAAVLQETLEEEIAANDNLTGAAARRIQATRTAGE